MFLAVATLIAALFLAVTLNNKCYFASAAAETDLAKLQSSLESSRACARSKAALDLQKVGAEGLPAVPRLVQLLNDPVASVRWRSVAALGHIGHFPAEVREAVYAKIEDPDETVRLNTLFAVSRMGYLPPSDPGVVVAPNPDDRVNSEVFSVLLRGLSDRSTKVQYKALIHLIPQKIAKSGPKYLEEFKSLLTKLSDSSDSTVSAVSLSLLGHILGVQEVQKAIPNYKEKLIALRGAENEFARGSVEQMIALLDGKTYPFLLLTQKGSIELAKQRCDSGETATGDCYLYGDVLRFHGDEVGALEYFEKDCNGRSPGWGCEVLGNRAVANGNRTEGIKFYRLAAEVYMTQSPAILKLGDIYAAAGDQAEACHWYLRGCASRVEGACAKVEGCPDKDYVLQAKQPPLADRDAGQKAFTLGEEAERRGDIETALTHFKRGHELGGTFATLRLASLVARAGKSEEVERILIEGCDRLEPIICLRLGSVYADRGDYANAERAYKRGCVLDRVACSDSLAEFEKRRGNREGYARALKFSCENASGDARRAACEALSKLSDDTTIADSQIQSCNGGNPSDCRAVAQSYLAKLDNERAVEFQRRACEIDKSDFNCRGLFDTLWDLRRWDEYRKLGAALCPSDPLACLREAGLDAHLGETARALSGYETYCVLHKSREACSRMHRLAVDTRSAEELKVLFGRLCDGAREILSCGAMAALHAREDDSAKRDEYLEKATEFADAECVAGDSEACAGKGFFQCAAGWEREGKATIQKLCETSPRYCRFVEACPKAMAELMEGIKRRQSRDL